MINKIFAPPVAHELIAKMDESAFLGLTRHIAMTIRPSDPSIDSHQGRMFVPVDEPVVVFLWGQWRSAGLDIVRSVPVTIFRMRIDAIGRVVIGEPGNMVAKDAAIADPDDPRFIGKAAFPVPRVATNLINAVINRKPRNILPCVPVMPDFYFGYKEPPKFELSYALVEDAKEADPSEFADEFPIEYLREFWESSLDEKDGMTYVPQRYLHRSPAVDYDAHPLSNSPRPLASPVRSTLDEDWIVIDGRWVPKIQQPDVVMADLYPVMGRFGRNLAYRILVEKGFLPPRQYRAWEDYAAQNPRSVDKLERDIRFAAEKRPDIRDQLIDAYRAEMGRGASSRTHDEDIIDALCDPRKPLVETYGARLQTIALPGSANFEELTFTTSAWEVRPSDVRPYWRAGFVPAKPPIAGRRYANVGMQAQV